jgi:tetratricopeptide (TPR) repeat protein
MTRFTVIVVLCCCAQLSLAPRVCAQSATSGHKVLDKREAPTQKALEPPELSGGPSPAPTPPTPALLQFAQSKIIRAADPHDAKTLAPAIREITALIGLEPTSSDFYLLRASLSCYARANPTDILRDIARSISLHAGSMSTAYSTLREHYTLKAKIEFETGHLEESMGDLDAAIKENYESAKDVFNDGNTKPSTATQPCVWTQSDLDTLEKRFPRDYRPPLYRGLYLTFFYAFDLDADYDAVLRDFQRSAELDPESSLPHFFIGELYTFGSLGGIMSMKRAKCLESVVPRTAECLALDEVRRTGFRSLTRAIAVDSKFGPAYGLRAGALLDLKEYRQAVRDYDKVLELTPTREIARMSFNDRGLSKAALGEYQEAILDFTQAIAIGCKDLCGSYDNRAEAYVKLHNYSKAAADISASIKLTLSSAVFLMNIDQFRRIYPEYDAVADEVLCEKLRGMFFPAMKYADFAKQFLIEAKGFDSTVLPDLYVKRGDAYAAMGQIAKANIEYDRVSRVFPEWARLCFVEKNGKRIRKHE